MSAVACFSLIEPAPNGFMLHRPSRPELLSGAVVVYAPDWSAAEALMPNIAERINGVIITPSPRMQLQRAGPRCLHLHMPPNQDSDLLPLGSILAQQQHECYLSDDTATRLQRQVARLEHELSTFRNAHNDATEELSSRLEDLKQEIRRREQAEESLRHAEKMRALGQLAGGVAHDFNNMLGGITGAAELLQGQVHSAKAERHRQLILDAAGRAAALTAKLLAFGRRGKVRSQSLDLHAVVGDSLAMLETALRKRVHVHMDLQATASQVLGDHAQLQNAVLNIGLNAIEAMPDGGELRLASHNPDDAHIALAIADTGCGIASEHLQHIFEPFFTTKEVGKGTGLGLAAAYGTVQEHGGTITVSSNPGAGTTFIIKLPLHSKQRNKVRSPDPNTTNTGSGMILVIEDETILRLILDTQLSQMGYRPIFADNGRSGLEAYRKHHHELSAVLLDMVMPELDGRACFEAMRAIDDSVPVLVVSGYHRDADIQQMERNGLRGYLQKPFTMSSLARALKRAIRP